MAFIHHIHLPARLHRREAGAFDQLSDVVDAGVGGGIDLDHIEGRARPIVVHSSQVPQGSGVGPSLLRQLMIAPGSGAGGLPFPGPAEQVGRCNPVAGERMAEGGGNRLLAHQLIEALGAIFVMQRLQAEPCAACIELRLLS